MATLILKRIRSLMWAKKQALRRLRFIKPWLSTRDSWISHPTPICCWTNMPGALPLQKEFCQAKFYISSVRIGKMPLIFIAKPSRLQLLKF
jgi:hypothetical protein